MGRGFWIMDNISTIHNIEVASESDVYLFKPENLDRYRFFSFGSNDDGPQFPNPSVTIDYYLNNVESEVQLEILNAQGNVIKSFKSGKTEPFEPSEVDMATGFLSSPPPSSGLGKNVGLNRFSWNMRHYGEWSSDPRRAYRGNGPMVAPGDFTVRLTSGDKVFTENFTIKPDPRNTLVTLEDMKAQEKLALEIRSFSDQVDQFVDMVDKERKALENTLSKERASKRLQNKKDALEAVYYQLVTPPGTYMKPMLQSQTGYLNSMLGRADQRPGKDAYDRLEEL